MPEVRNVIVILRNPSANVPGDTGQVTIGYYTVEGDTLTMTDSTGKPMRRHSDGEVYTHKLKAGDDPHTIAGLKTKTIRTMIHGDDGAFNRPLHYRTPQAIV
jgi:hypothetical protein